ncbi:MAG: cytochrome c peroxidase [Bacteroidota bacterium]|nr:cytochrome c peroxidase [Bacteroidota bacterium]
MWKNNNHKKTIFLICFLALAVAVSFKPEEMTAEEASRNYVISQLDSLLINLKNADSDKSSQLINYLNSRKHYKRIEFFVEYYSPFHAKYFINGPLVPKHEIEFGNKYYKPQGFQVIEENIFGTEYNSFQTKKEFKLLDSVLTELRDYYKNVTLERANLSEAVKLQFIRIMSLNLNGYDCTLNKNNIIECVNVFEGLYNVISLYNNNTAGKKLNYLSVEQKILSCIKQLKTNTDNDSFNRLNFITKFVNPTFVSVKKFFNELNISPSQVNYALNLYNTKPFSFSEINTQHFALYRNDTLNSKLQSQLGYLLFFDPVLSGNNKRACASCHQPSKQFTDGLDKSLAIDGKTKISRNSPTLLNAAYQKLYFYDGRLFNLEEQAGEVLHNTFEMNITEKELVAKLKQSSDYKNLFKNAFKNTQDSGITFYAIMKSIAEFIRTLKTTNSRFDNYINGNFKQLSANEIKGYNLFTGKALCGSCHFFPIFNGTVPPSFNENEFEVIGTPETNQNLNVDSDIGREAISKMGIHKYAFKTPSVRNLKHTSPYMHNGVFQNLDEVLTFYNKGGGNGFGLNIHNQTLPFDSLKLSKSELNELKSFLNCLNDSTFNIKPPKILPKFGNSTLNNRKVGGLY